MMSPDEQRERSLFLRPTSMCCDPWRGDMYVATNSTRIHLMHLDAQGRLIRALSQSQQLSFDHPKNIVYDEQHQCLVVATDFTFNLFLLDVRQPVMRMPALTHRVSQWLSNRMTYLASLMIRGHDLVVVGEDRLAVVDTRTYKPTHVLKPNCCAWLTNKSHLDVVQQDRDDGTIVVYDRGNRRMLWF